MTEINWPTPFGYTTFCDDIRNELNGKTTLVGIYASEMIVHVPLPVVIAKLGLAVHYFERPGESNDPVKIEVYLPGDADDKPQLSLDVPTEQLRNVSLPSDSDAVDSRAGAVMHMILSPLHLVKEGRIKVRARRGSDVIRLGSLLVRIDVKNPTATESKSPETSVL